MTLQSSGIIYASNINAELFRADATNMGLGNAQERWLADVPSGAISMSDFYSKINVKNTANVQQATSGLTTTFTGVSFGTDFSGRTIIVCTGLQGHLNGNMNLTSVTIGGVAADGSDSGENESGNSSGAGVWAAKPTGTSGNVVLTWSGVSADNAGIFVLSVANSNTAASGVYSPIGGAGGSGWSGSLNVPSNGLLVVCSTHANANAETYVGVTKRLEWALGGHRMTAGWDNRLGANGAYPISSSWTTGAVRGRHARSYD